MLCRVELEVTGVVDWQEAALAHPMTATVRFAHAPSLPTLPPYTTTTRQRRDDAMTTTHTHVHACPHPPCDANAPSPSSNLSMRIPNFRLPTTFVSPSCRPNRLNPLKFGPSMISERQGKKWSLVALLDSSLQLTFSMALGQD